MADTRVGYGYDIHRLVADRPLILGGRKIECDVGLLGHSDADVVLHALTDAILGAIGEGDIGEHFPDTDPANRDAASDRFLRHALDLARAEGFAVGNADVTIVAERPRLGPLKAGIRASVADLLGVTADQVSVKARTREGLGPVGRGEAIEAHVVVLVVKGAK
jgi:2-C-methyl-D-erythritol 2,4-cyclodiphosphate synthase